MYHAAMEEKQLAVQAGEIGSDGFPVLTVVVDGYWAKRSYRNNYSSLSGAWDFEQKKLYTRVSETGTEWSALEQQLRTNRLTDIAVVKIGTVAPRAWKQILFKKDLYMKSVAMYGIKYTKIIGDEDSNENKTILDSRPYDALLAEKLDSKNPLFRNFCLKLNIF
ncbi:uncharacterized protein TNCT_393461 [Trichonephila clavata]|uniref:Mutator-like transposase domain-containing protein n=1 Tax=Trichonephila clavata TaxID=2740835 RepID=A0A8X6GAP9_TRICU|nr:uncharacterized protein TNCT_393461 [Trichonephila clavata]